MRRLTAVPLVIAGLSALVGPGALLAQEKATGVLEGRVRYLGKVPAATRIMTTDGGQILHRNLVVDGKSKGLRHVAAVLEGVPAGKKLSSKKVVVDQRDMLFLPRVVSLQEGQTIRFENNDLCNHAVNALSTNKDNVFNIVTPQGSPFEYKFKAQKRPVVIGCPIHGWMRAWVYVLPHPYHAITDETGTFQIADIPAGKYTLQLHHADSNRRETRSVVIEAGKTATLNVDWQ